MDVLNWVLLFLSALCFAVLLLLLRLGPATRNPRVDGTPWYRLAAAKRYFSQPPVAIDDPQIQLSERTTDTPDTPNGWN